MFFYKRISQIIAPILSELPYFLFSFFLLTPLTIADVKGQILSLSWDEEWYAIFRYLCVVLLYCYASSAVIYLFKGKIESIVKALLYVIPIGLYIVYKFLSLNFNTILNPQYLLVAGETNTKESLEFLGTFLFTKNGAVLVAYIVAILAGIVLFERYKKTFQSKVTNWLLAFVLVLLICGIIPSGKMLYDLQKAQTVYDVESWHFAYNGFPMDLLTNLLYCMKSIGVAKTEVEIAVNGVERLQKEKIALASDDSLNLILVTGESFIKHHSSLYGYNLPTNPRLTDEKSKGNLFVFNDVVSPYNLTSYVLRNMFFTNSISYNEKWYKKVFLPALFKKSGYRVYFWDNQKDDNPATAYAFSLNALFYNSIVSKYSYTEVNKNAFQYDKELIDDFYRNDIHTSNNLILFHLMGQHLNAAQRYPHEEQYSPFNKEDIKRKEEWLDDTKREAIAHYDNATYYNDYVLSQIIEKEKANNTVLIYLSDHGEEIYDYRDSEGRKEGLPDETGMRNFLKYQNDIPFMIWCSPKYQSRHPDIIEKVRHSIDRPFSIDNLPHLLLGLGGIKTKYYQPQRDLISAKYKCNKRIVYDEIDYDKLIR